MRPLGWLSILRLGLVNAMLGGMVGFVTFTLNRVMTVELALPAIVPGALVALHYAVQLLRPWLGLASDLGGRRTPWILGGLAVLSAGVALAAVSVSWMAGHRLAGIGLAAAAYALVGAGVGAVGTSSLAMMAVRVGPSRRAAAAMSFWLLMIVGAVAAAGISARLLHPFSLATLVRLACGLAGAAFLIGSFAVLGIEPAGRVAPADLSHPAPRPRFGAVLADIWGEPQSRRFAIFVFVSMLAYSAQELILEPFAGAVFALTPAQTAGLTGLHQGGVLAGMLLAGISGSLMAARVRGQMRFWTIGGCAASAFCLLGLAAAGLAGPGWPLRANLVVLGIANGAFAVSAIGAMLGLAGRGRQTREGIRMGLWGAAQAVAMGAGGLLSTGTSDLARAILGSPGPAYAAVFLAQAALFVAAARLAASVFETGVSDAAGEIAMPSGCGLGSDVNVVTA